MSGDPRTRSTEPTGAEREIAQDATEILVRIDSDRAITTAREHVRRLSTRAGFGPVDRALLATTVSELGRNILLYAGRGDVLVTLVADATRMGVAITACDDGPGILDVDDALRDGYSTSGRPGLGLPGIKRVCDEFHVSSSADEGTTVSVTKWRDRS
jgi:serine/threonine-protein kinase RsbT